LFWYPEKGMPIDEFLDDFPGVTNREQVIGVIEIAHKIFTSGKKKQIYEAID
jgi:uncharacterized protein (DUF433 family)